MRAPSPTELLLVWERGQSLSPARRALLLAGAASDEPPDQVARFGLGERDARLLALREQLFGSRLESLTSCPVCSERVEIQCSIADIRVLATVPAPETVTVTDGDCQATVRVPNSMDMLQLEAESNATGRRLLEQCLVGARCRGEPLAVDEMPEALTDVIEAHLAEADPQADVQLTLKCPQCSHQWRALFDIASFLWAELHAWAVRQLREVHALASAYGWREAEILALDPRRRQAYLELIQS